MSFSSQSPSAAMEAILAAQAHLLEAQRSIDRARGELAGEAAHLAARLGAQLGFMSEVAELLAHELARDDADARLAAMPVLSRTAN